MKEIVRAKLKKNDWQFAYLSEAQLNELCDDIVSHFLITFKLKETLQIYRFLR